MISTLFICTALAAAPSVTDVEQAKIAFQTAEQDYRLGNFEQALENYRKAYTLYPRAEFLFNIGQAQRGLRNWREAAFSFELYLQDAPDAEDAAEVRQLIEQMRAKMRSEEDQQPGIPGVVTVTPPPPEETQPELQLTTAEEDAPLVKKWWFWVAIGTVVAAGAATAVLVAKKDAGTPSGSLGTFDYR